MKPHPFADEYPAMTAAEYDALVRDIKLNGLRFPIVTFEGQILDGRHRYEACYALGIAPRFEEFSGDAEAASKAVDSLNLHRRHMTIKQRKDIAKRELKENTRQSDSAIARKANVADKTVAAIREQLEERSEITNVATRIDSRGREQPAKKKLKEQSKKTPVDDNKKINPKQRPVSETLKLIVELVEQGFNPEQIGEQIGIAGSQVRKHIIKNKLPGLPQRRAVRISSGRIVSETINTITSVAHGLRLVDDIRSEVSKDAATEMLSELRAALKAINKLVVKLKEVANG